MKNQIEMVLDILKPVDRCRSVGLEASANGGEEWIGFPVVHLYRFGVPESTDMLCENHRLEVSKP